MAKIDASEVIPQYKFARGKVGVRFQRPSGAAAHALLGAQPMAAGHVAHFEILRELGKGAMGEVYLARDTKLQRLVALKTFPSSAALLHEARLASAVSHPNVAHVYQAEEEYIAMEYVEGETLDKLIAQGPLTPERSLDIAIQIASALEEAHRKGVVHRDIKPSNVMLSERGLVKVLDFGLARATVGSAPADDDAVAGTIAYMSPEQAMGEAVDGRSDLFSFGVVLYEMLTGRRPFQGPTVSKTLAQILNASPPPVERSTPLAGIISHCLEKNPDDRYQNATELLNDLKAVRESARPRQSARQLVGIAAIVAVVFAVIAATIWQASGQGPLRSVAVLPFTSSGGDEAKAIGDGLAETLINRLSRAGDELRVVSRPTSFAYNAASLTPPRIGRDLRADTLVTGRIKRTGDRVEVQVEMIDARRDEQIWGRHYSGSVYDLVRIQEDIAAKIGAELKVPMSRSQEHFVRAAMTRDPEAFREFMTARHLTNQRLFATLRKSFAHYEAALKRDPNFALAHAGVAESWIVLVSKRGVASREGYPKALAAARRAEALDPYSAEVHTLLGDLHLFHLWDWNGAGRHFERAIELNPHYVTARHWYGSYLSIMGRHDEAIAQMRIAQQLEPSTSRFIAAEGRVLFAARRYSEAEMMIKRAIELEPDNKNSWDQLASIYLAQGRVDDSVAAFQKSLPDEVAKNVGAAYARGGYRGVRIVILDRLKERTAAGKYVSPADWAIAHVRLGDMDGAFRWLDVMFEERNDTLPRIFVSPSWDPIRKDPRYAELVERVGIPISDSR